MSNVSTPSAVKEYVVRVPKKSRKNYHMMRFHKANGIDFKGWSGVKMERENNYKEYKNAEEDMPRYGAGSEFGREQRDEARRKKHGIKMKKYKPEDQPWLLSVKDKNASGSNGKNGSSEKKFKGIREGGVSENSGWYVFLQAKDGAFEAYAVEEWYNFQPINRYNCLNAEEAEKEFEKRDKIVNFFSVMYQKKLRNEEEDADGEESGKKKGSLPKGLMLSEMDDWMSDKESDDDEEEDEIEEKKPTKKKKPLSKKMKRGHQGVKKMRKENGDSGTDCEEESDDYDEGAEHEYMSEDSSDSEQENDEKVTKDLAGVEEDKGLKKLLNSDEEDDEDEEKKKEEEENKESEEEKKKKTDTSPEFTDSSDDEKIKSKDSKKDAPERASDTLKRKLLPSAEGAPLNKKPRTDSPTPRPTPEMSSEGNLFEEPIRRYLLRKPMTTTELLQKLKSKKTGHSAEQLVQIIAVMLKKINPTRQRVKGKMYLSLKA